MSAQIDTLSITVPGHVVRKNTEGPDSVLIFTGEQAAHLLESLSEIASLLPLSESGGSLFPGRTHQDILDLAPQGKLTAVANPKASE